MILETAVSVIIACTNQNWQKSPDCTAPVEHFVVDPITRNATGTLTSGKTLTQTWYGNIMIFEMEQVKYAVYGNSIVYLNYHATNSPTI